MRGGDVALGMVVRLARSADIARIAKTTGHDFIFLDLQHALYDKETLGHVAQTALGCGVTAMARVQSSSDPVMPLLLDAGFTGIVVPDVNTADDAKRAVDACKFKPIGKRSVSGAYPMFDFRSMPLKDMLPVLNDNTLLVCMIETVEGVKNMEAIAAVEGVDVIHLGCNDLLVDMGNPGAFGSPEIIAIIEREIAACKAHGKFSGLGGDRDPVRQARFIKQGIRFVTTQTDIAFLMMEATRRTTELRQVLAAGQHA
ncbi:MAG: aldolase [Rhizobiales bacterium]|nr:aldolase [Hyphomicrobiales bacterium]